MTHFLRPLALVALALACSCEGRQAADTLHRAAAMVEQQPDSALLLLEAMEPPHRLRNEYALRYLQAKDKANHNIADDTAIFAVAHRYVQGQDREMAALVLFYCGRVRYERGEYDKSAHTYLMADDHAQVSHDYHLQGLISSNLGRLSYERLLFDEAAAYYKKALLHFQVNTLKYSHVAWTLTEIGDCFLLNEQPDSALHYYGRGLSIAEQHRDTALLSTINHCIGVALQQQGKHELAKQYFKRIEQQGVSPEHRATLYCNLAHAYFDLHRKDSAQYYAQQVLRLYERDSSSVAHAELANAYGQLANVAELSGNHRQALQCYRKYVDHIDKFYSEKMDYSIWEVRHKYQTEKLKNENSRLLIEKQRFMMVALLLIVAVLVVGAALYLYRERSKRRLENAEKNVYVLRQLTTMLSDAKESVLGEKEQLFRQLLVQRFDLQNSLSQLEGTLRRERKDSKALAQLNALMHGQSESQWELLYHITNELYNGALDKLRSRYPRLNEQELRVCCLTYAKLRDIEISVIMNLHVKTIQNRKSSIRRELHLPESGDIGQAIRAVVG